MGNTNHSNMNKCIFAAIIIFSCLHLSCAKRSLTIEERLMSADPQAIRSALIDMWRTGDGSNIAAAVRLLDTKEYFEDAAFALSLLDLNAADNVVLAGMTPGRDNTGRLLYFYFVSKKRPVPQDVKKFSHAGFNGINYDPGSSLQKKTAARPKAPVKNIVNDIKDRVIIKNPYWAKELSGPVMPSVPGTYKAWHTANPDILVHNGMIYFYYRGGDGTDRICLATAPYDGFNGKNFIDCTNNPIIGTSKKGFDSRAALDPAAIYFDNKVFLYYSGLGDKDDSVGLAVSGDFYNFNKHEHPVIKGRAPEVLVKDGLIYMYYVLYNNSGGYSVYLATSRDGYNFTKFGNEPVFAPDADPKAWDSKSVTVPRIIEKNGVYYMLYAGDNKYLDYPPYFGLAFSYDLVNWHRGTQNPVSSRGAKGSWDDGGIWYGQMFEYGNKWYLYYEGWGGGESHEKEYGPGGHSQIGLATGVFDIGDLL